jgi:spore maturation protein CgeB
MRSPLTVLLVVPKYNYGRIQDGFSYEYFNFYDSLRRMGNNVILFDFMRLLGVYGQAGMNYRLREMVYTERPDVLLAVPHREELSREIIRSISDNSDTITVSWFSDDHWRFESHTARWAPCFNWSITTDGASEAKYRTLGYEQVIKSQWACNHFVYKPVDIPMRYNVTFVGQPHGTRRAAITAIREAGIDIEVWGRGWENGRLSQDQMLDVFSSSRINLNLANASPPRSTVGRAVALLWRIAGSDFVRPPLRAPLHRTLSQLERLARPILPRSVWDPDSAGGMEQIKGRNFEVPGCGGLLLSAVAESLSDYYIYGEEIATFSTVRTMVQQLRHLLSHPDECARIKVAGYRRTIRNHTYVHRFSQIFALLGLRLPPIDEMLVERVSPGQSLEVS